MNDPYIDIPANKSASINQQDTVGDISTNKRTTTVSITRLIARIAVFAGLMIASKFAFPYAPFIDLTGVILIACALRFGWRDGLSTSIVYLLLALVMWPVGWWILTWIIWYPALALSVAFLPKHNKLSPLFAACIGTLYVSIFGILSSLLYVLTNMSVIEQGQNVVTAFWGFYVAGIWSTFLYMVTTIPLMFGLVYPLDSALRRIA
jgi:hypothetical protein